MENPPIDNDGGEHKKIEKKLKKRARKDFKKVDESSNQIIEEFNKLGEKGFDNLSTKDQKRFKQLFSFIVPLYKEEGNDDPEN